jgi:hypothetical protein
MGFIRKLRPKPIHKIVSRAKASEPLQENFTEDEIAIRLQNKIKYVSKISAGSSGTCKTRPRLARSPRK